MFKNYRILAVAVVVAAGNIFALGTGSRISLDVLSQRALGEYAKGVAPAKSSTNDNVSIDEFILKGTKDAPEVVLQRHRFRNSSPAETNEYQVIKVDKNFQFKSKLSDGELELLFKEKQIPARMVSGITHLLESKPNPFLKAPSTKETMVVYNADNDKIISTYSLEGGSGQISFDQGIILVKKDILDRLLKSKLDSKIFITHGYKVNIWGEDWVALLTERKSSRMARDSQIPVATLKATIASKLSEHLQTHRPRIGESISIAGLGPSVEDQIYYHQINGNHFVIHLFQVDNQSLCKAVKVNRAPEKWTTVYDADSGDLGYGISVPTFKNSDPVGFEPGDELARGLEGVVYSGKGNSANFVQKIYSSKEGYHASEIRNMFVAGEYGISPKMQIFYMSPKFKINMDKIVGDELFSYFGMLWRLHKNQNKFEDQMLHVFRTLSNLKIFHKDLHQGNWMVEKKSGRIFVIDFGRTKFVPTWDADILLYYLLESFNPSDHFPKIKDEYEQLKKKRMR